MIEINKNTNEWLEQNYEADTFQAILSGRVVGKEVLGGKLAPVFKTFEKEKDGKPFKTTLCEFYIESLTVKAPAKFPERQKVKAWGKLALALGDTVLENAHVRVACTFRQTSWLKTDGSKAYETEFTVQAYDILRAGKPVTVDDEPEF